MNIYRFWAGEGEPPMEPWLGEVIRNLHPLDELVELNAGFLSERTRFQLSRQVRSSDYLRHLANYARWKALGEDGGVWLDHDVIPLMRLTKLGAFTAAYGSHRSGCVIGVDPVNRGFAREMVDRIFNAPNDPTASCVDVSGDNVVHEFCPGGYGKYEVPFSSTGKLVSVNSMFIHTWQTSSKRQLAAHVLDS